MSTENAHLEKNKKLPAETEAAGAAHDNHESGDEEAIVEMSADELDGFLSDQDPEFAKKMHELGGDDINAVQLEGTSIDGVAEFSFLLRALFFILPGSKFIFLWQRKVRAQMRILLMSKSKPKDVIKDLGKLALARIKYFGSRVGASVKKSLTYYKKLSGPSKLLFLFLVVFSGSAFFIIFKTYNTGLLPKEKDPFIGSLGEVATSTFRYKLDNGREFFYDSLRVSQNLMYLPKTVVNIKASARSGSNPMMAFELYLEGVSPEVLVEFKDREPEMKDLVQRQAEEMTFDQMDTEEGKRLMTRKIRIAVNGALTTGRIKKIYFKTFILKP